MMLNIGSKNKKIHFKHKISRIVIQVFMTIIALIFLLPIYIIFSYSFKTKKELYVASPFALPESLYFENYKNAFDKLDLDITYFNTFFYTILSVIILVILCGAIAWAIARCNHRFFKLCYVYFIIGLLVPYQALFLSIYIVGNKLNLTNTRHGIILMYVATGISFGVFLMNSFVTTVPVELEEAAKIDGCTIIKTYFKIVMPLLRPAMATLIIMQAFQIWNDFLLASLYVSNKKLKTVTVAIQSLFSAQANDYNTAMAAVILSALPITILFLSLQKYFIKGMTVGAVKG